MAEVEANKEQTEEIGTNYANCIACGAVFIQRTKWQEFCSNQHRAAWRESIQYLGQEFKKTKGGAERFMTILKVKLDSFDERALARADIQQEKDKNKAILKTSETWGAWIDRNYKTEEERKAFIDENYDKTYISAEQIVGETAEHFIARTKENRE